MNFSKLKSGKTGIRPKACIINAAVHFWEFAPHS